MNNNYRIALAEVNEILKYTDDEIVNQIPKKFMDFILNNMETNYEFKVQEGIELFEQLLRTESKTILAMIYRDYFCSEDEKKELIDYDKVQIELEEKIKRDKYNPDNLFKNKKSQLDIKNMDKSEQSTAMIEVKNKNFWQKIFDKLKNIFTKKY